MRMSFDGEKVMELCRRVYKPYQVVCLLPIYLVGRFRMRELNFGAYCIRPSWLALSTGNREKVLQLRRARRDRQHRLDCN